MTTEGPCHEEIDIVGLGDNEDEKNRYQFLPSYLQDMDDTMRRYRLGHPASELSSGGSNAPMAKNCLDQRKLKELRRQKINFQERKRTYELNVAFDDLREVMPFPNGRKMPKITTLVLAKNYILTLKESVEEMKRLVGKLDQEIVRNPGSRSAGLPTIPPAASQVSNNTAWTGPPGAPSLPRAGALTYKGDTIPPAPLLPASLPLLPVSGGPTISPRRHQLSEEGDRLVDKVACSPSYHTYTIN